MRNYRSALWLLIMLTLLTGACASGDAESASGDSGRVSRWAEVSLVDMPDEAVRRAKSLISSHGDQAPLVLLRSLDRGYDPDQLAEGIRSETIESSGTIAGITPDRPNSEVFESSSGVADQPVAMHQLILVGMLQADNDALMVDRMRAIFSNDGDEPDLVLVTAIIALHSNGYSLEQIVNAIVLGEAFPGDSIGCLRDIESSEHVRPAFVVGDARCTVDSVVLDQDSPIAVEPDVPEAEPMETVPEPTSAEPIGPVTFTGSATEGSIQETGSNDLRSIEFTATVNGDQVTIDASFVAHYWFRGGYEEVYVDQNCGATYRYALHFEGQAGNPTHLEGVVDASEIVEVQGVLCDDDDTQQRQEDIGAALGSFSGKANGLGIDGTFTVPFRSIDVASSGG